MLTDFELGKLVGLLEGEGTFTYGCRSPMVRIKMNDKDVIEWLADIFGRLTGKTPKIATEVRDNPEHNDSYYVQVYGESARIIMRKVVHFMGYRRRKRIWQCLNGYKEEKIDLVNILNIKRSVA